MRDPGRLEYRSCPACGRRSAFYTWENRYYHLDGTPDDPCWVALLRGDVIPPPADRTEHALYRFYDADGQLLYVGITLDPGARWRAHSKEKRWWHEVSRIDIERFDNRESVLIAERDAIVEEFPLYNVIHNRLNTRDSPEFPFWAEKRRSACPVCGARPGDMCVTKTGNRVSSHKARGRMRSEA